MDYDKQMEKVRETNEKYLKIFTTWLESKNLSKKTIKNHYYNVEFYINDFLNYYDFKPMEQGCFDIDDFLGNWFIRKAMWSTPASVKSTAASIKKFYLCMSENGFVSKEDYGELCYTIKCNMEYWQENAKDDEPYFEF